MFCEYCYNHKTTDYCHGCRIRTKNLLFDEILERNDFILLHIKCLSIELIDNYVFDFKYLFETVEFEVGNETFRVYVLSRSKIKRIYEGKKILSITKPSDIEEVFISGIFRLIYACDCFTFIDRHCSHWFDYESIKEVNKFKTVSLYLFLNKLLSCRFDKLLTDYRIKRFISNL